MIGTISTVLSATIVNVAFPAIMRELDVGHDTLQWVSTVFLAATATTMLNRVGNPHGDPAVDAGAIPPSAFRPGFDRVVRLRRGPFRHDVSCAGIRAGGRCVQRVAGG